MHAAAEAWLRRLPINCRGVNRQSIHEGPHLSFVRKRYSPQSSQFSRGELTKSWPLFTRKDLGKVIVHSAPENVPTSNRDISINKGLSCAWRQFQMTECPAKLEDAIIRRAASGFHPLYIICMSPLTSRREWAWVRNCPIR